MPRPKCYNCGRRTAAGSFSGIRLGATGEEQAYCTHRRACRIALQRRFGNPPLTFDWPSDTAYAAASEAADLVELPWPLRWLPGSMQDEVRHQFPKALASAVEQRLAEQHVTGNLTTTEGA